MSDLVSWRPSRVTRFSPHPTHDSARRSGLTNKMGEGEGKYGEYGGRDSTHRGKKKGSEQRAGIRSKKSHDFTAARPATNLPVQNPTPNQSFG